MVNYKANIFNLHIFILESSRKTSISALLTSQSLCVDHNKLFKILKEMGYQTTWPASWETYMQVRKQQSDLDMEQQTGSK